MSAAGLTIVLFLGVVAAFCVWYFNRGDDKRIGIPGRGQKPPPDGPKPPKQDPNK